MKNMILILALVLVSNYASAVCTSPVSRTNLGSFVVLTSTKYNADLNALYTQVNELPGDCITINTLSGTKIIDGTITNAKISTSAAIANSKIALNYVISTTSSGNFTTTSTSQTDVTNMSATITTTGRPVEVSIIGDGTFSSGYLGVGSSLATAQMQLHIVRGSTIVSDIFFVSTQTGATATSQSWALSSVRYLDVPAAGTYTYKIAVTSGDPGHTAIVSNAKLLVREL